MSALSFLEEGIHNFNNNMIHEKINFIDAILKHICIRISNTFFHVLANMSIFHEL